VRGNIILRITIIGKTATSIEKVAAQNVITAVKSVEPELASMDSKRE
jgi:hypothetical protein